MSKRSGKSRGVFVLGGAALVALGVWMGGLFNGFGLGGGNGTGETGDGKGKSAKVTPKDGPEPKPIVDPGGNEVTGPLEVVLEPNGYSIVVTRDDTRGYSSATIREIVTDAIATEDQSDGYRVKITSRAGVSAGAHQDLVRQLEAAGLAPDEILGYDSSDVSPE